MSQRQFNPAPTLARGSVTITIVIPYPVAPETTHVAETFKRASQVGGTGTLEAIRHGCERLDLSKRRHEKFAADWKSATRDARQWGRHGHRIPTKDLWAPTPEEPVATATPALALAAK